MQTDKLMERTTLNMPDKFCLYSGMRNPSRPDEIAWQQFDTYPTKQQALNAMRARSANHGGLWLIIRETPVAGMLPTPDMMETE